MATCLECRQVVASAPLPRARGRDPRRANAPRRRALPRSPRPVHPIQYYEATGLIATGHVHNVTRHRNAPVVTAEPSHFWDIGIPRAVGVNPEAV